MENIQTNEIIKVIEESGVEQSTALTLQNSFNPFFEQANEWALKAKSLVVTDISQTREMKMAREARLALKEIRVKADKTRKSLKEDSLRYGKAVQGVYAVIEYLITPIEKYLEEQENFPQIQEAKRKAELKANREMDLQPYAEFVPLNIDLSEISDIDFEKLLNGAKLQLQAKIEVEKKAEIERAEKERQEKEEREKIQLENERLMQEAAEREKAFAIERARQEKERKELELKAKEEAAERERIELLLKEKAQEETKILQDKIDADNKLKLAPDKEKLEDLSNYLKLAPKLELSDKKAITVYNEFSKLLNQAINYLTVNTKIL